MQERNCSLQLHTCAAYFRRATLDFDDDYYLGNSSQPVLHNYYTLSAIPLLS